MAVLASAACAGAVLASPAVAASETTWLCKPGETPNPCRESLETTVVSPAGGSQVIDPPNARRPKIDCFYVYPTVSEQPGPNADLTISPEQVSIAEYQASRYSQRCRVFAPVYRQLTLAAINGEVSPEAAALAYGDVRGAWRDYLRHYNKGRGVVLIGHSQGTFMLRRLIRSEIDPNPKGRTRLVSAILLGGNVTVRKGSRVGGDFKHIPACVKRRQTGCVIAFSVFDETPPDDAVFGVPTSLGLSGDLPSGAGYRALCTNPAALGGGPAKLKTLLRTEPFGGPILAAGLFILFGGPPPSAPTPWLQPGDRYSGECVRRNGVNYLEASPIGDARDLHPSPTPAWGLHLTDANIALGDLVDVVKVQAGAYAKARAAARHR